MRARATRTRARGCAYGGSLPHCQGTEILNIFQRVTEAALATLRTRIFFHQIAGRRGRR